MEVGKQIRAIREAKGLSQGDIEKSSGLLRSYISRVEGGYTAPSLGTLERFAKALGVQPYQLMYRGHGPAKLLRARQQSAQTRSARKLMKLFDRMDTNNRKLLLTLEAKLSNKK